VKQLLAESCDKIDEPGGNYDALGHSHLYGFGRLNAARAVELARGERAASTRMHRIVGEVAIRDHETAEQHLEVADPSPITALRVDVNLEHSWRGDLTVRLRPPPHLDLAAITLHDGEGASADDLRRVYDESAVPALATLRGLLPAGRWTLEVTDSGTKDEGRIVHFGLEFDT
jgi:subtilisin-like proprotein convertase family protein